MVDDVDVFRIDIRKLSLNFLPREYERRININVKHPRETDQNRGEGFQVQQIHHVSNGRGCDQ